jgi:hypothetical protein
MGSLDYDVRIIGSCRAVEKAEIATSLRSSQ